MSTEVFCLVLMLYPFLDVLLCFVVFSLDGNLAHNARRLSLSIEIFILLRSCTFLCAKYVFVSLSSIQITRAHLTLSGILKVPSIHKPTTLRIIGQTLIIQLQWTTKIGEKMT
jgi:hypothetical protein